MTAAPAKSPRATLRSTMAARASEFTRPSARALPVVELRCLPDPTKDVMAVDLRIEEGRPCGEDHDVRMQPNIDQGGPPERQLDDDALLGALRPLLAVLEVARPRVDDAHALRRRPKIDPARD